MTDTEGVGGTKTMPWHDSEFLTVGPARLGYEVRDGAISHVWLPGGHKEPWETFAEFAIASRLAVGYPQRLRSTPVYKSNGALA